MRSITLSPSHYAAKWPIDDVRKPAEITQLGVELASFPKDHPARQDKMLEILRCFNPYLQKYLAMILQGKLPMQRRGADGQFKYAINADTHAFLSCFLPKEKANDRGAVAAACRTLHLAFKGMRVDEVFDQLVLCMVNAIERYDPFYSKKIEHVCTLLDNSEHHDKLAISASELNRELDYDSGVSLRYLTKRGYLVAGEAAPDGEVRFARSTQWPPESSFFQSGPVGLPYYVGRYYRYNLLEWINSRMGEIEAKDGVFQLFQNGYQPSCQFEPNAAHSDRGIPHANGNLTNPYSGRSSAVDTTLLNMPVDIGEMNLDWVNKPKPGLFYDMSKSDRHLLYCYFVLAMSWEGIANTFNMASFKDAKRRYQDIMQRLQEKVSV